MKSSTLPAVSAARVIVDRLVAEGITTFFGIPGGPACALFEAIRLNPGAQLIVPRHEAAAGYMAVGYQKASGKVPCVVVTAGPGITNSISGIASLYLERCPAVVLASDVAWMSSGRILAQDCGPQGINADALLAQVTTCAMRLVTPNGAAEAVMDALERARSGRRCGPAAIIVPIDVAYASSTNVQAVSGYVHHSRGNRQPFINESVSKEIVQLLANAQRPLVIVGSGCDAGRLCINDLLDELHLPFITTPRAKGIIDEEHPMSLGNGGMGASRWATAYVNEPPDVVLALGTDLDDTSVSLRCFGSDTKLIHVDVDRSVFGRNHRTHIAVCATVIDATLGLVDCFRRSGSFVRTRHAFDRVKATVPRFDTHVSSVEGAVHPGALMRELDACRRSEDVIYTDVGGHMLHVLQNVTCRVHMQLQLGAMGSGICGAIGHALARSDQRVICVTGDGCFQMHGFEVLTAKALGLNIVFMVVNDGRHGMVHHGMKQLFGEADGYELGSIEYDELARKMRVEHDLLVNVDHVKSVLRDARCKNGPIVVNVDVDPSANVASGRIEALQAMSQAAKE